MATSDEKLKIIIEAQNKTAQALKEISSGIEKIGKQSKQWEDIISSGFEKAAKTINTLKGLVIGGVIGRGLLSIGKDAIQLGANLEQTKIAFETMTGSAETAKKLLSDLSDFAAKTPFQIVGIRDTAKQLIAMGVETQNIIPTLKMLGDVSAGLSVPIEQIAYAYGQVRSANQLYGTELRQFVNAGVPILGELARMFGVSEAAAKQMVEQGKVGFKDVETAFKNMSGEGGKFFNLMDKQSQTVAGKRSNLQDNITRTKEQLGNAMLPVLGEIVDGMVDRSNELVHNKEKMDKLEKSVRFLGDAVKFTAEGVINFTSFLADMGSSAWGAAEALGEVTKQSFSAMGVLGGAKAALSEPAAPMVGALSTRYLSPTERSSQLGEYFGNRSSKSSQTVSGVVSSTLGGGGGGGGGGSSIESEAKKRFDAVAKEHADFMDKIRKQRVSYREDVKGNLERAGQSVSDTLQKQIDKTKEAKKQLEDLDKQYTNLVATTSQSIAGEVVSLQDQLVELDKRIQDVKSGGSGNYIELLGERKRILSEIEKGSQYTTTGEIAGARSIANESNIDRLVREGEEKKRLLEQQTRTVKDTIQQEQDATVQLGILKKNIEDAYMTIFRQNANEQLSLYDQLIGKALRLQAAKVGSNGGVFTNAQDTRSSVSNSSNNNYTINVNVAGSSNKATATEIANIVKQELKNTSTNFKYGYGN